MSEVVVVASLHARPGKEDDVQEALGGLVGPTHAEQGCLLYSLHRGVDDPSRFAFVERWSSRDDLNAHLTTSPELAAVLQRAGELLASPPDIAVYDAVALGHAGKGSLAGATG